MTLKNKKIKNNLANNKGILEWPKKIPLRNQIDFLPESFQWISEIYKRDGLICQGCGVKCRRKKLFVEADRHLPVANVDHIKPMSVIIKELGINQALQAVVCREFWDLSNGRTLCEKCHRGTATFGGRLLA